MGKEYYNKFDVSKIFHLYPVIHVESNSLSYKFKFKSKEKEIILYTIEHNKIILEDIVKGSNWNSSINSMLDILKNKKVIENSYIKSCENEYQDLINRKFNK